MSVFKAGQRVRIVGNSHAGHPDAVDLTGSEGTLVGIIDFDVIPSICRGMWEVRVDGRESMMDGFAVPVCDLAPLTDSRADAFLESIRQLKPLELEAA